MDATNMLVNEQEEDKELVPVWGPRADLVQPAPQIDRRTGVPFGVYSNEEVKTAVVEAVTMDTLFDPESNTGDRVYQKMLAESDPKFAKLKQGIGELMVGHYDYMDKASQAFMAMSNVRTAEDKDYLEEAFALDDEAAAIRAKFPMEHLDKGLVHETILASAEGVATMYNLAKEVAPGAAKDAITGAGLGAMIGIGAGGVGAAPGAIAGLTMALKVGIPARTLMATWKFGKGELMMGMLRPGEGKEPIPIAIAAPLAEKMAVPYAMMETVGYIGTFLAVTGLVGGIANRIKAIAGEGATEWGQTIIEQYTAHMGRKELAAIQGKEFTETFDDVVDYLEAKKAARQGMLATGGMSAPSAAVQIPTDAVRFVKDRKVKNEIKLLQKDLDDLELTNRAQAKANEGKPVITTVDPVTNELVEGTPISKPEIDKVKNDTTVKGTNITDSNLDDLTLMTDEDLDTAIAEIEKRLEESVDDKTANFFVNLGEFLQNDEQNDAVMELIYARAQTLDMSISQYVEHHGLEFQHVDEENAEFTSMTTFVDDSRTIITAFQKADMSSVVNELGRVFRRDMPVEMQGIADDFVGVERGKVWDAQAEDKFAAGWENYLATGQAPSQELVGIFQKLHSWITNIYKTIRGSSIDIEIPADMRKVYDSLLVKKEVAVENSGTINVAKAKDEANAKALEELPIIEETTEEEDTDETPDEPIEPDLEDLPIEDLTTEDEAAEEDAAEEEFELEDVPIEGEEAEVEGDKDPLWIDDIEAEDIPEIEAEVVPGSGPAADNVEATEADVVEKATPKKKAAKPKKAKIPTKIKLPPAAKPKKTKKKNLPPLRVHIDEAKKVYSVSDALESEENYVPKGADIHAVSHEFRNAREAMEWIMENGTELQRPIARRIHKLLDDVPITIVENGVFSSHGYPIGCRTAYGVCVVDYHAGRTGIYIMGKSFGRDAGHTDTFLHESLHAATVIRTQTIVNDLHPDMTNPLVKAVYDLNDLRLHVINVYQNQVASGQINSSTPGLGNMAYKLGSIEEFLAYGMSNPHFQKWLAAMPMKKRSGFSHFVKVVRGILGFGGKDHNALTRIIDISDRIIPETKVRYPGQAKGSASFSSADFGSGAFEQKKDNARMESTVEDEAARIKAEREAIARSVAEYEAALDDLVATGITEEQAYAAQKKALVVAMRRAFDAGDLHGYKMARNTMKAFLARERARFATQKKHTAVREKILNKLEKGLPDKMYGKTYVKMDPELAKIFRKVLDEIGGAKTIKQIRALYDDMDLSTPATDEVTFIVRRYLDGAVSRNSSGLAKLELLNSILTDLLKGEGAKSPMMQLRAKIKEMKPELIAEINGGHTIDTPLNDTARAHEVRKKQKTIRQKIATMSLGKEYIFGLGGLMRIATSYARSPESKLYKLTNFYKAKQRKMTRIREQQQLVLDMYQKAFGLDGSKRPINAHRTYEAWNKDAEKVLDIGAGVLFSKSELRQLWMYMQNETLTNRLVNMFRDKSDVVTDDMTEEEAAEVMERAAENYEAVKEAVEDHLTEEDIEFATALMEHWASDELYNRTNAVYEKVFGIALGRVKDYVPIRSRHFLDMEEQAKDAVKASQFEHDNHIRKTPTSAKSIRERVKHADKYQLFLQGDVSLFNSFTEEMAHFESYAEQAALVSMILEDKDVKSAIEVEYGPDLYRQMTKALEDVLADGIHSRTQYPMMDKFRGAFVRSTIGASTSVFLKQQISLVQYMQNMPAHKFITGLAKFYMNPKKNLAMMLGTEYIKNRKNLIDRDMKQALSSGEYKRFMLNPVTSNFLTMNVQIGDALAIAQGAWVFKEYLKGEVNPDTGVNYTEQEALDKAFEQSEKTQQSGMQHEQSNLQRGGSFAQFVTMYSTGPVQAVRQEIEAVRDYAAGRIKGKQLAKTLFIYHWLVPSIFAAAASALGGDDGEEALKSQLIAMSLGPFGAAYASGSVITEVVRRAAGLKRYALDGPFGDVALDISKLIEGFTNDKELDLDDYAAATQAVLVLTGHGVPVQRATRTAQNLAEGDIPGAIFSRNPDR